MTQLTLIACTQASSPEPQDRPQATAAEQREQRVIDLEKLHPGIISVCREHDCGYMDAIRRGLV